MNACLKMKLNDFYNSKIIPFNGCHSKKFEVIIR